MNRNVSMHTFQMQAGFSHEDEGTPESSPDSVVSVMKNAKTKFPGIVTSHHLSRSIDVILGSRSFKKETTLLATSFCCDEVCRDLEDELRAKFGQNFSFGGIAGLPFGGSTAFGALCHHVPQDGQILICYGPHIGIDYDGVLGKVNRRGHKGSGSCCNTANGALQYVKAVKAGTCIHCPDPSDPVTAQTVFINSQLMEHADRVINAENEMEATTFALYDCADALMKRILDKCLPNDLPNDVPIALLGGIGVNTPEGTPEYFLPKKFTLCNRKGEVVEDLLSELIVEGTKDIKKILLEKRLNKAMEGLVDVPVVL